MFPIKCSNIGACAVSQLLGAKQDNVVMPTNMNGFRPNTEESGGGTKL